MEKLYTVTAFSENRPGVLQRITVVFTRRKVNIESLTVSETEESGISRFTILVRMEDGLAPTIIKQVNRIIEVREVFAHLDDELVFKEIAFLRVATPTPERRIEVEDLAQRYKALVEYVDDEGLILQTAGTEDNINSLYRLLEPYGVEEFVRSGRIALTKLHRKRCDHRLAAYS